jgi:hypothetical protein
MVGVRRSLLIAINAIKTSVQMKSNAVPRIFNRVEGDALPNARYSPIQGRGSPKRECLRGTASFVSSSASTVLLSRPRLIVAFALARIPMLLIVMKVGPSSRNEGGTRILHC